MKIRILTYSILLFSFKIGFAIDSLYVANKEQIKIDSIQLINDTLKARWNESKVAEIIDLLKANKTLPDEYITTDVPRVFDNKYLDNMVDEILHNSETIVMYDLRGIPFNNKDLSNVNLSWAQLEYANLDSAVMNNSNLKGVNLKNAKLNSTKLASVNLDYAYLESAELAGADLNEATLRNSILIGADFENAKFYKASLQGSEFCLLSAGDFFLTGITGIGKVGESLSPANLKNANLAFANLEGTIIGDCNLTGANLFGAIVSNTPIDVLKLKEAKNYQYIQPGRFNNKYFDSNQYSEMIQKYFHYLSEFFNSIDMYQMSLAYQYWENETITQESIWYIKFARLLFLKWTYGYGAKPSWLLLYGTLVVLIFTIFYILITLKKSHQSGIYKIIKQGEDKKEDMLKWDKGLLILNCLYFSLLSLVTFGYGVFKPRQWFEFFRLNEVEYKPIGWARIIVGLEATLGIYLIILFSIMFFNSSILS